MQNSFISQNSLNTLNSFKQAHGLKNSPTYSEAHGAYYLTLTTKEASEIISEITDFTLYQELTEEGYSEELNYISFGGETLALDTNSVTLL